MLHRLILATLSSLSLFSDHDTVLAANEGGPLIIKRELTVALRSDDNPQAFIKRFEEEVALALSEGGTYRQVRSPSAFFVTGTDSLRIHLRVELHPCDVNDADIAFRCGGYFCADKTLAGAEDATNWFGGKRRYRIEKHYSRKYGRQNVRVFMMGEASTARDKHTGFYCALRAGFIVVHRPN